MSNRMKVLVAYDGSECADAAVDDLRRAGLPADALIKVLSVVENWLTPPSGLEIIEHIDSAASHPPWPGALIVRSR